MKDDTMINTQVRPKRVPVSGARDILTVQNLPQGKVARWVNDKDDRTFKFLQGGWQFVTDKGVTVGEKTVEASRSVGTVVHRPVGQGTTAYLMVIDKEWYEADQESKANELDSVEADMYRNLNNGEDGTYGNTLQTRD